MMETLQIWSNYTISSYSWIMEYSTNVTLTRRFLGASSPSFSRQKPPFRARVTAARHSVSVKSLYQRTYPESQNRHPAIASSHFLPQYTIVLTHNCPNILLNSHKSCRRSLTKCWWILMIVKHNSRWPHGHLACWRQKTNRLEQGNWMHIILLKFATYKLLNFKKFNDVTRCVGGRRWIAYLEL